MIEHMVCLRGADLWVYMFAMPGVVGAGIVLGFVLGRGGQ
jgi:hypothetical protein